MLARQNSLSITDEHSLFAQVSFGASTHAPADHVKVVEDYVPKQKRTSTQLEIDALTTAPSIETFARSPSNKLLQLAVENAADVPIATTLLLVLEGVDLYDFFKKQEEKIGKREALELALSVSRDELRKQIRTSSLGSDDGDQEDEEEEDDEKKDVSIIISADNFDQKKSLSTSAMRPPGSLQQLLDADPEYTTALRRIRSAFENPSPCGRFVGMEEDLFCAFIAPALTLTTSYTANHKLAAQMNTSMSGYIRWDDFSNFFVKYLHELPSEGAGAQVQTATREFHHSLVTKILFAKKSEDGATANHHMNGYCVTAGYDGAVNIWDTNFYDHVKRIHCLPSAMKNKKWVNDICYSLSGRLVVAQTRGLAYVYNIGSGCRSSIHRVFRVGAFSEDEGELRLAVEKSRLQGANRSEAATYPAVEMCTLNTSQPGDIRCIEGPKAAAFTYMSHMDPLLVGLDNGLVLLYNAYKPVEFRSHADPLQTMRQFERGNVTHIVENVLDNVFLTVGQYASQQYGVEIIDYETFASSMSLHLRHGVSDITKYSLLRCDYDASSGLILATGASRTAAIFSSSLPEPICLLSDHSAPIVGSMMNMAKHQLVTVTRDHNFHIFDVRMLRKLHAVADTSNVFSDHPFSAGAFDGYRGCPVAASCVPVALSETTAAQSSAAVSGSATADDGVTKAVQSPSGLATEMMAVAYNPTYQLMLAAEGNHIVCRSGRCFQRQEKIFSRPAAVTSIRFDSSGRRMLELHHSSQVTLLNGIDGEELSRIECNTSAGSSSDEVSCACFAHLDPLTQVVVVGTAHGSVMSFLIGEAHRLIQHFSVTGSVSCIENCGSGPTPTTVIVGTSDGEVVLWNVQTKVHTLITKFAGVHCGVELIRQERSKALAMEQSLRKAQHGRRMSNSSSDAGGEGGSGQTLAAFQSEAHQKIDLAVERIIVIDSLHILALYGTGLAVVIRVGKLDCNIVFTFPCVDYTASCCSGAFDPLREVLAVGDGDGTVLMFSLAGYLSSVKQQSAAVVPHFFDSTKSKASRAALYNYVAHYATIYVGQSTPVSSITFTSSSLMLVSLFDALVVHVLSPKGGLLYTVSSYRWPGEISVRDPSHDHPFFELVSAAPPSKAVVHGGKMDDSMLMKSVASLSEESKSVTTTVHGICQPVHHLFRNLHLGFADVSSDAPGSGEIGPARSPAEAKECLLPAPSRHRLHSYQTMPSNTTIFDGFVPTRTTKPKFKMPGGRSTSAREGGGLAVPSLTLPVRPPTPPTVCGEASRPATARRTHDDEVAQRLYPAPTAPHSARAYRPPSGKAAEDGKPSILYSASVPPCSQFVPSEVARLHPPTYTFTPPTAPKTPTFASAQPVSPHASQEAEKRLLEAVNTATNITGRIERNIKMLRIARSGVTARTGNVFQSLEQQPLDKKAFTTKPSVASRRKRPPV